MMIMKKYSWMLLAGLFIGLAACSDDKNNDTPAQTPNITVEEKEEWESGQILFGSTTGSQVVHFTTNVAWTAKTDQEWCKVQPTSGNAGDVSVTLTLEENTGYDERNASFVLTAGTAKKTFKIVQKQKDALMATSATVEMDAAGGNFTVEMQSNLSFDYEIDDAATAWIAPVETKGLTTTHLQFNAQPNDTGEKREGKIVFRAGELSETVTVYQAAADTSTPTLVLTQNEYTVGSDGEEIVIELKSNVEYEMVMPQEADWLSEVTTRSMSTYTRRILVAPNDGYDMREADIHFVNASEEIDEVVHIVQVQKDAILVAKQSYPVGAEAGQLDFVVNTNVDFEVSVSAGWIRQAPKTRGLVEVPLSFVYDANTNEESREAVIKLSAEGVEQSITVVQEGEKTVSRVSIVHSGLTFTAPLITGTSFSDGVISWGDGSSEEYSEEASHTYPNENTHTVVIESVGAEEITLPDLVGVSEIDLSAF